MTTLRASQIETLEAVGRLAGDAPGKSGYGASPARVAAALNRRRRGVEDSLIRLEELGYVEAIYRRPGFSAVYGLTYKGRSELSGGGGS